MFDCFQPQKKDSLEMRSEGGRVHQTVREDHYSETIRVLVTDNETAEREPHIVRVFSAVCCHLQAVCREKKHNLSMWRQSAVNGAL